MPAPKRVLWTEDALGDAQIDIDCDVFSDKDIIDQVLGWLLRMRGWIGPLMLAHVSILSVSREWIKHHTLSSYIIILYCIKLLTTFRVPFALTIRSWPTIGALQCRPHTTISNTITNHATFVLPSYGASSPYELILRSLSTSNVSRMHT